MGHVLSKNTVEEVIEQVFAKQKAYTSILAQTSASQRIAKLKALNKYLMEHQADLETALYNDFKKPATETTFSELWATVTEIKFAINHLSDWLKLQTVATPLTLVGTSSYIKYEPKGNVLIISPWNYPFLLAVKPLVSAIAAGNAIMLKPSELTPHTSAFIKRMATDLFPEEELAVVEGDVAVATELLKQPFNHIFYTGNTNVGKIIMRAAAEHLASVTLELGGKSPCIVDETADIVAATSKIAWGKFMNSGQTCIAPDYLLLHEDIKDSFVKEFKERINDMYDAEGTGVEKSESYARIVNQRHFNRVSNYIADAVEKGASIVFGGKTNAADNFIEPTLISNVSDDMLLMKDEIFGPVLPFITYRNIDDAIAYINKGEKPLALYVHTQKGKNADYVINRTSAGDSTINDVLMHIANPELPFGGVNHSGIGKSNGFFGFQEFSNMRGVMKRNFGTMAFIYPPYTPRVRRIVNFLAKYL